MRNIIAVLKDHMTEPEKPGNSITLCKPGVPITRPNGVSGKTDKVSFSRSAGLKDVPTVFSYRCTDRCNIRTIVRDGGNAIKVCY